MGTTPEGFDVGRNVCTCEPDTNGKSNTNPNVKSVGQECPTHTGNFNTNGKSNTNPKVKGVGQECPTHTTYFTSLLLG